MHYHFFRLSYARLWDNAFRVTITPFRYEQHTYSSPEQRLSVGEEEASDSTGNTEQISSLCYFVFAASVLGGARHQT